MSVPRISQEYPERLEESAARQPWQAGEPPRRLVEAASWLRFSPFEAHIALCVGHYWRTAESPARENGSRARSHARRRYFDDSPISLVATWPERPIRRTTHVLCPITDSVKASDTRTPAQASQAGTRDFHAEAFRRDR